MSTVVWDGLAWLGGDLIVQTTTKMPSWSGPSLRRADLNP